MSKVRKLPKKSTIGAPKSKAVMKIARRFGMQIIELDLAKFEPLAWAGVIKPLKE